MMTTPSPAERWYLTAAARLNRCSLSPQVLASQAFQDCPQECEILRVRDFHAGFLAHQASLSDAARRSAYFHDYALGHLWMHEDRERWPDERERLRRSYVSVLRGWGHDANGQAGAMFKGWAERTFGLRCIYHGAVLHAAAQARDRFARERMRGWLAGVEGQLDLLYTVCQAELRRLFPGERWLTLYRGSHDPEAYLVKNDDEGSMVEFNTVSSFTSDREVAWEFGSRVWSVRVPLAKIVYFSGLLDRRILQGEREFIVLGGDYRVRDLLW